MEPIAALHLMMKRGMMKPEIHKEKYFIEYEIYSI